jgi:NADPH:quinone reductase-like Zn-dependent oxidoreductase
MQKLKFLVKSRKFWAAVGGVVAITVKALDPNFPLSDEQLTGLIETGKVKPVIEKIYSWKDLAAAHKHMENGKVTGKIAVKVI